MILYMEKIYINKNNNYLLIFITSVWLIFSCFLIIKAFHESKLYDNIVGNTIQKPNTILEQKIVSIQNTIQANNAIKNHEYEKALQIITWNKSEDYYNRGTIQTILAYDNALQSEISWLEKSQELIIQAKKNLDIAKKLSVSITTTKAIINNEKTIDSLSAVIDIKTCYGIGQKTVTSLNDTISTIKSTKDILEQEGLLISQKEKQLDISCYERLQNIVNTSKKQLELLQSQIQKDTTKYISDFSDKIDNPMICIDTPYENIIPSINKWNEWLKEYQQQHINTTEVLKKNNSKDIQELCNQTKNDAQINQKIENALQELLQKLEENNTKRQEIPTNQVQYKDFFNEDEKKALENIKKTNQWRIDTILDIRGKWNYTPERYLDDMFNEFYGNSGDFIDLHK